MESYNLNCGYESNTYINKSLSDNLQVNVIEEVDQDLCWKVILDWGYLDEIFESKRIEEKKKKKKKPRNVKRWRKRKNGEFGYEIKKYIYIYGSKCLHMPQDEMCGTKH